MSEQVLEKLCDKIVDLSMSLFAQNSSFSKYLRLKRVMFI